MKRKNRWYSKSFLEQRGTNIGITKLFRSKEEQTKLFQYFSGPKWNKPICSKTFQDRIGTNQSSPKRNNVEQKETLPKLVPSVY